MRNSKITTLLFLLVSNFLWANPVIDSLKIKRLKNHVSSIDYITRQIDNSKFYLNLNKSYCDSILAIDSVNQFALALQYFKESSNKEIYQKSVLEVNLGIIVNEFDKKTAEKLLKKSIQKIESEDISIYISTEVNKRIEIGKNILKLND